MLISLPVKKPHPLHCLKSLLIADYLSSLFDLDFQIGSLTFLNTFFHRLAGLFF